MKKTPSTQTKKQTIAAEMHISIKSIYRYKQKTMELLRKELKEFMPLFLLLFYHP